MNTIQDLKPIRKKALAVYGDLVVSRGFLPSVREFCRAMGYSSSSTGHAMLGKLREHGYPCYTRNSGHIGKDHQGPDDMAKAVAYWLNRPTSEDDSVLRERAKVADALEIENRALTEEVVKLKARLAAAQRWVVRADRRHGVEKTEPHEWKEPVRGRLDLMIALGEISR